MAALLLLLALPGGVAAHAELVASTPGDGETLTTVPAEAVLTFSEALGASSTVAIVDSRGATVATGVPDPAHPTVIRTALPALRPGTYEVQWTTVADDGHIERGTFAFTIAEPTAPPATPTPAPTNPPATEPAGAETPVATPIATPAPVPDGGSGTGAEMDMLLPIVAVAVLVGVGLAVMLRRGSPA
jgi:methionine-rich copper-binding protein CopC